MEPEIGPVGSLSSDQVRRALIAATHAPSLHNSQPWRFRCTPTSIELFADLDRALPAADPDHRELLLACGAALMNLRLDIRSSGVHTDVRLCPDPRRPDLVATVRPRGRHPHTPLDAQLARAITHRHTNRRQFTDRAVSPPLRHQLRHAAQQERAWLAIVAPEQVPHMRQLVRDAHEAQVADPAFQAEWRAWTARAASSPDGVPETSSGPLPEAQDDWVHRDFSAGRGHTRVPGKDFETEPLIVVVGSFHDMPLGRIQAGQAMQRVLLTATAEGLSASFLSQVVEVPAIRSQLRTMIGGALWPQTVLRIGYGSPISSTPRRGLAEVLDVDNPVSAEQADTTLSAWAGDRALVPPTKSGR